MESEVYEAFKGLGVSDDNAIRAATALSKRDADVQSLRYDITWLKAMVAVHASMTLALLIKAFIH